MPRRINCHIRGQKHIFPDHNFGNVQNRAVIIGSEIFTNLDMRSIITVKRRVHKDFFSCFPQNFLNHSRKPFVIAEIHGVKFLQLSPGFCLFPHYAFIRNIRQLPISPLYMAHRLLHIHFSFYAFCSSSQPFLSF